MRPSSGDIHEYFAEDITKRSSETLMANMTEHGSHGAERVVLELSTRGGEVESAMHAYTALRATTFELTTYNASEVASAGNVIFLAGVERLASADAAFFFHPLSLRTRSGTEWSLEGLERERMWLERRLGDPSGMRELDLGIARLKRQEREVRDVIVRHTKLTENEIRELVREAQPIGATDALAMGIIHKIIPAKVHTGDRSGSMPVISQATMDPCQAPSEVSDLRVFDARVSRRHALASCAASPLTAAEPRTRRRG